MISFGDIEVFITETTTMLDAILGRPCLQRPPPAR